jgi:Phospholipase_D-nuclease N-terminal
MVRAALYLVACDLVLLCLALIDCLAVEKERIRGLPRALWVVVILAFSPIGAIAWYVAGRPLRPVGPAPSRRPPTPFATGPSRRPAPDDDPEFLAGLSKLTTQEQDMLQAWEDDLRRPDDPRPAADGEDKRQRGPDEPTTPPK